MEGAAPGAVHHFADQTILHGATSICSLPKQKVNIYLMKSEQLVICITETSDLNLFSSIAEILQPFVKRPDQKVISINFQSSVMHKGPPTDDQERFSFVRGINSQLDTVPELKEPNILTGVSAGGKLYFLRILFREILQMYAFRSCIVASIPFAPILCLHCLHGHA